MSKMMKAAVFIQPGRIELVDKPIPDVGPNLSLIHISEPTRQAEISYAVFCLKKKKKQKSRMPSSPLKKKKKKPSINEISSYYRRCQ